MIVGVVLAAGAILAYLAARFSLRIACESTSWQDRRLLALAALWGPALLVGSLLGGAVTMLLAGCPWLGARDQVVVSMVASVVLSFMLFAVGSGTIRAAIAWRDLEAISTDLPAGPIFDRLGELAERYGLRRPRLRVVESESAVACTYGLFRPTVLVSTWIVAELDDREQEALLGHELAHLAHRDHAVAHMAAWLRDWFFFLPTGRGAWAMLQCDRELACDAACAQITGRPGALASALVKVAGLEAPRLPASTLNLGPGSLEDLDSRLSSLLDGGAPATSRPAIRLAEMALGGVAVAMALAPFWYTPLCMLILCRLG